MRGTEDKEPEQAENKEVQGFNIQGLIDILNNEYELPKKGSKELEKHDEEENTRGACGEIVKGKPLFCPACGCEFE